MLQIRDFTQSKNEHVEFVKNKNTLKKCKEDDILIGRYGASIGKILTGLSGAYNVAIVKTLPNKQKIDKRFLFYVLRSNSFQNFIQNIGYRAAQAGFNKSELIDFKTPLPTLDQQIRIANILDTADALCKKDKELLATYDELLQATFLDMFGDMVSNPKKWKEKSIGEICRVQGGLQLSPIRSSMQLKAPYLRVANVYRNRLELTEIKTIGLTEGELKKTILIKDDILIVEGHGNKQEIGRCSIWDGSIQGCVHQNHLIRLRLNDNTMTSNFLTYFINSEGGKKQMLKTSNTTSGLNTISTGIVKKIKIFCPPLMLQNQFTQIVTNIEAQKVLAKQNLLQSEEMFNALVQKAFKGELE
jgi:type I restriction enzyme S subunit